MRHPICIAALAAVAVGCGSGHHAVAHQPKAVADASVATTNVKVTGDSAAEVQSAKSILSGMSALDYTSLNVGAKPDNVSLDPPKGTAWLTFTYPAAGLTGAEQATIHWETRAFVDAWQANCKQDAVPCGGGFTLVEDDGTSDMSEVVSPQLDQAAAPSQSPQQMAAAVTSAAEKAGWGDVKTATEQGDVTLLIVSGSASTASEFQRGLGAVLRATPNSQIGVLVRVTDADTGQVMAVIGRGEDGATAWVDPAWKQQSTH